MGRILVAVGSLLWMALLTGVMVVNKTYPGRQRLSPVIGIILLGLAALRLVHPFGSLAALVCKHPTSREMPGYVGYEEPIEDALHVTPDSVPPAPCREPKDIRDMKAYIDANRTLTTPFDIVQEGETPGNDLERAREIVRPFAESGATWWTESRWSFPPIDELRHRIQQGPLP